MKQYGGAPGPPHRGPPLSKSSSAPGGSGRAGWAGSAPVAIPTSCADGFGATDPRAPPAADGAADRYYALRESLLAQEATSTTNSF